MTKDIIKLILLPITLTLFLVCFISINIGYLIDYAFEDNNERNGEYWYMISVLKDWYRIIPFTR